MNALDRAILALAPRWGLRRAQWRAAAGILDGNAADPFRVSRGRHYEAAQFGRRTEHWKRSPGDANSAQGPALHVLRNLARDLCRNNPYAKRGKRIIANHVVGWGINPLPTESAGVRAQKRSRELWDQWAGTTQCDYGGRLTMSGLQYQVMTTIAESGEALVRRYTQRLSDGLAIPLQLQVLEPDHLDTAKDGIRTPYGGRIIQGVEFNRHDKPEAYWLFPEHPGQSFLYSRLAPGSSSKPIPAADIQHVFDIGRAGAVRDATWFADVIGRLQNVDTLEDAELVKHQVAACLSVLITDVDGTQPALGVDRSKVDTTSFGLEPGMAKYLPPGADVTIVQPPAVTDSRLAERGLAGAAMGLGVTVEDLTGNYRQMPFSAARGSRLEHWANVEHWRWNMLVPMHCDRSWVWAMEMARAAGLISAIPTTVWSAPPMAIIDPEKEGLAAQRDIRNGRMTPDDMVRQLGHDPATFWASYAAAFKKLDELGIVLDCDPRVRTQQGNAVVATPPMKGKA